MTRLLFPVALALLCASAYAAPIDRATLINVLDIGYRYGVPESVTYRLQIEESGDPRTGGWGDPEARSRYKSKGYHSRGLFQLYEEPVHLKYLLDNYYPSDPDRFRITDPIHNAFVALPYLAALHDRFGNWYEALVYYNCGKLLKDAPAESKAYARRIVNARAP